LFDDFYRIGNADGVVDKDESPLITPFFKNAKD
jgi:hypothetical protein